MRTVDPTLPRYGTDSFAHVVGYNYAALSNPRKLRIATGSPAL
jgi:hypothetical protein